MRLIIIGMIPENCWDWFGHTESTDRDVNHIVGNDPFMSVVADFERELEIFRTEAEAATQFLYAYPAIHEVAGRHRPVRDVLNSAALFWNTNLGAPQTSTFIALGRDFDQQAESKHNIDRLLRIAQDNPDIFTKAALGIRKQGQSSTAPEWLDEYLKTAYEPTAKDFRWLRELVKKNRKIYETKYRDIRHKWFAHKEIADSAEIGELFAKTNIRELQRLVIFLGGRRVRCTIRWAAIFELAANSHSILRSGAYAHLRKL